MIRKLLAQALIKEVGRDDSPGKPVLYGVTDEFMDAFNLKSLDELPELKEIESEFDEEDIFNTKYQEKVEEKPETNQFLTFFMTDILLIVLNDVYNIQSFL